MDTHVPSRYDALTRLLHGLLATGITLQLALSAVMTVPAGRGMGVRDWHRAAFEWHARLGLAVAALLILHWLWSILPSSRPGVRYLFPWVDGTSRRQLLNQTLDLFKGQLSPAREMSALAGTVHGLGLLAVTGSAVGGIINYLGYFVGLAIPNYVLHWVARWHIAMGYLVLTFLIGHVFLAVVHRFADDRGANIAEM